ncbi:P-loop containing nucleoside triphosphate hydrolase protein [Paraphysoderma sedebokerense]|nr:P-loop containing nucleoside triphosphate hydrolase protein [Paraphysoderma sedebokerense]
MPDKESVKVIVRCRPFSDKEKAAGHSCIVVIDPEGGSVTINPIKSDDPPKTFTFDYAFDWNCKQHDVYNKTARPIVESVLNGYNGTIFAYGQTGTGKTFSMEGIRQDPQLRGIIPNSFEHIFSHINSSPQNVKYLVRISYLEIYNEEIRDLLKTESGKLDLKERPDVGVYVKDLSSFVVKDTAEMDKLMEVGNKNRSVGFTEMNARSSRSHSIFTITVEMCETVNEEEHIRVGKLHLVDLAGSERQSKTGATGERLKEATKINMSLSCLGNVIKALVDGKSSHIPYRDSKLTRLLQDSLGGNAKTMMIATMSPASYNYDETLSTLRYASRAKNIKNKPKINEDPKDAMLREFQEEIRKLRQQLETADSKDNPELDLSDAETDEDNEDIIAAQDRDKQALFVKNRQNVTKYHPIHAGISDGELSKMQESINREKQAILESKDLIESEKQKILSELESRASELSREITRREQLMNKLAQMESKLLIGGVNILDTEAQQRQELAKREAELEEQRRKHQQLQKELQQHDETVLSIEENYTSLSDEATRKTQKLKQLWSVLMQHKTEIKDLTEEFQQEREDLLSTIRELSKEVKLRMLIINRYIPTEELSWIEAHSDYDDASEKWQIKGVAYAGNNIRGKRTHSFRESVGRAGHHLQRQVLNKSTDPLTEGDYNYYVPVFTGKNVYLEYDARVGSSSKRRSSVKSARSPSASASSPSAKGNTPSARGLVAKTKHYV